MEGGRKRRKLQNTVNEEEEEEEEEEEKMKLFFALIQNTKAMRERIKSKESSTQDQDKSKGIWNPKFQPEDFIEDHGFLDSNNNKSSITLHPLAAASSSSPKQSNPNQQEQHQEHQEQDKVREGRNGLDLNLSL